MTAGASATAQPQRLRERAGAPAAGTTDVSIVMLSYNTKELTAQCLRSLEARIRGVRWEVIIVDNASQDGSPQMIREQFPSVTLICNQENLFGPVPLNEAIRRSRGRYVMILNTDVVFLEGTFERMYDYLEAHPDVGAVSPRLVNEDGVPETGFCHPKTFGSCLLNYTVLKWILPGPTRRLNDQLAFAGESRERTREVPVMVDISMLIRREALEAIGLYDEAFKLYFLDDDLSLRLRAAGWTLTFLGEVANLHYRHQSVQREPASWIIAIYRQDALAYARKYFGRTRAFILRVLMGITAVLHDVRERLAPGAG